MDRRNATMPTTHRKDARRQEHCLIRVVSRCCTSSERILTRPTLLANRVTRSTILEEKSGIGVRAESAGKNITQRRTSQGVL